MHGWSSPSRTTAAPVGRPPAPATARESASRMSASGSPPASAPPASARPSRSPAAAGGSPWRCRSRSMADPLRLLVVDDEPLAVERLQLLLARIADVQVAGTASDGAAALRLVEALAPDAVLLDIAMPGMDG